MIKEEFKFGLRKGITLLKIIYFAEAFHLATKVPSRPADRSYPVADVKNVSFS
jgi:hypothetical protein